MSDVSFLFRIRIRNLVWRSANLLSTEKQTFGKCDVITTNTQTAIKIADYLHAGKRGQRFHYKNRFVLLFPCLKILPCRFQAMSSSKKGSTWRAGGPWGQGRRGRLTMLTPVITRPIKICVPERRPVRCCRNVVCFLIWWTELACCQTGTTFDWFKDFLRSLNYLSRSVRPKHFVMLKIKNKTKKK